MSDLVEYAFLRRSSVSGELHTLRIAMTAEQYAELQRLDRRHIQELLPQCTDVEREFLMTGITPEEWNALIKNNKENRNPEEESEPLAPRSRNEILAAERKLFDQIWYSRQQLLIEHERIDDPETLSAALKAFKELGAKYPPEDLGPWNDFQWGMHALRQTFRAALGYGG